MGIRQRRNGRYDVFAKLKNGENRIATVDNKELALAISNVVKMATNKHSPHPCGKCVMILRVLSEEAYLAISSIDRSYSIESTIVSSRIANERAFEVVTKLATIEACKAARDMEFKAQILLRKASQKLRKIETIQSYPAPQPMESPYPEVPRASVRASNKGESLPELSGIYFLWAGDFCEYVGQSKNICQRVRFGHESLLETDMVSYLLFDIEELPFAESYYIGIMRPRRNFALRRLQPSTNGVSYYV